MNNSLGILKEKRRHTKRPSPPFYYGKHYYKKNGNHMCKPKMTMEDFCKKYPNVKNTDWTHIQFAFRNQKLIVMNQS